MKNNILKQIHSFSYAISGIFSVFNSESHMRFHLIATIYVVAFALKFYSLSTQEWVLLVLTISSVWVAEIINTAIERLCDAVTKEYSKTIKFVKDASAGAVLITAIAAVAIAFILLFDLDVFISMITYFFKTDLWALIVLIVSFVPAALFVGIKPERYLGFIKK